MTRLRSQTQQARTHNSRIIVNQSLPRHLQAITTDDPSGRWWQREARAPALRGLVRLMPSATQNRLLAALPPAELERYFSGLRPVSLTQRQVLYEPGASLAYVYFVEEGVVSILTKMADATTIEVGMIGIEGAVGTAVLLGGETTSQQALVQVAGSALRMNAVECKAAFDQSPAVRAVMMRFIEALFDLSAQTAACNRIHTIEQRCARWLLMARDRLQDDIMPMTHEFLASMLGVRRAGVTETAGELQRSGLIRYHHGRLTIIDREGLEATACECYRIDHNLFMRVCDAGQLGLPEKIKSFVRMRTKNAPRPKHVEV